jgi:nicotinamidase-related amidase
VKRRSGPHLDWSDDAPERIRYPESCMIHAMLNLPANAVLILIDVQRGFDEPYWGVRNNPAFEENVRRLLSDWRARKRPVIHVRHMSVEPQSPLRPNQPGNEFKLEAAPVVGEKIIEKTVNSAFIGTDLQAYLREHQWNTVVIAGLSTDHCVSTTTRMSGNLGFNTYLVADACATFNRATHDGKNLDADSIHSAALASLHGEFATVVNCSDSIEL